MAVKCSPERTNKRATNPTLMPLTSRVWRNLSVNLSGRATNTCDNASVTVQDFTCPIIDAPHHDVIRCKHCCCYLVAVRNGDCGRDQGRSDDNGDTLIHLPLGRFLDCAGTPFGVMLLSGLGGVLSATLTSLSKRC